MALISEESDLVRKHNPNIVILTETCVIGQRALSLISSFGFENFVKIDVVSFFGGIWLLWNSHVIYIEPLASSFQELHCKVKVNSSSFILSAIYASASCTLRESL